MNQSADIAVGRLCVRIEVSDVKSALPPTNVWFFFFMLNSRNYFLALNRYFQSQLLPWVCPMHIHSLCTSFLLLILKLLYSYKPPAQLPMSSNIETSPVLHGKKRVLIGATGSVASVKIPIIVKTLVEVENAITRQLVVARCPPETTH